MASKNNKSPEQILEERIEDLQNKIFEEFKDWTPGTPAPNVQKYLDEADRLRREFREKVREGK